jgi:hypothetical protein
MALMLSMTECMRGVHHFVDPALGDASDRELYFRIQWGAPLRAALNPLSPGFLRYQAHGAIFVQGLGAAELPCAGSLRLDYVREHKIIYDLRFEHEGRALRYLGEKTDVRLTRPLMLVKTHTTCYGRILDEAGRILSRSVVHFEPSATLQFLASTRLSAS